VTAAPDLHEPRDDLPSLVGREVNAIKFSTSDEDGTSGRQQLPSVFSVIAVGVLFSG
jgi:hypothetical protein